MKSCVFVRFCKSYNISKNSSRHVKARRQIDYISRRLGFDCPPNSFICSSCKKTMFNNLPGQEILRYDDNIDQPHLRPNSPVRNNSPNPEDLHNNIIRFGQLYEEQPFEDPFAEPEPDEDPFAEPEPEQFLELLPIPEQLEEPEVPQNPLVQILPQLILPRPIIWMSLATTQNRCCICPIPRQENAPINSRCSIPEDALMVLWINDRIFINPSNRCCRYHFDGGYFTEEALVDIRRVARQRQLSQADTSTLVERLSNKLEHQSRAFLNFDSPLMTIQDYETFTSLTIVHFDIMFETCRPNLPQGKKVLSLRNCFAMLLTKMRTNFSMKILGVLFGLRYNQEARVSEIIQEVLNALMLEGGFVSNHLGFNTLTRLEWFNQHGTRLTQTLYGLDQDQLCCILDETYLFCQKPSNHQTQTLLYSMPKHRHLIKMMSIVSPSGRFYDMLGPYPCDGRNNDAAHLIDLILQVDQEENIFNFFQEGDLFLVDRGYRDAIPTLDNSHIRSLMPSTLIRGQRQHTDLEANRNRWITMIRELVERAHGRLKQKFKIFRDILPNHSANSIATEFKLAAAMANAFFPRLKIDRHAQDLELAERVNQRLNMRNELQTRLEERGLLRARVPWINIDPFSYDLLNFPNLEIDDIKYLTLGIYQLKMSRGYIQAHMNRTGLFEIQICRQIIIPNEKLIRAKISSKYGGVAKINTAYVSFNPISEFVDHRAIAAWYCDCKNGARVLGMCVHVTSIVFYLGYVRHHPELVNLPSTKFLEGLINNRLPPENFVAEQYNQDGLEIPQDLEDQDH